MSRRIPPLLRRFASFAVMAIAPIAAATGQTATVRNRAMFVNDEFERYTRVLQVSGDVAPYPWSVRVFGPSELDRLLPKTSEHPWAGMALPTSHVARRVTFAVLPARMQTIVNSEFPYGYNDGPVWAGRGVTTVLEGGLTARAGPLSLDLAPLFFRAENTRFPTIPSGGAGDLQYADFIHDGGIDQPQRFGDRVYARLDPGNSTVRLDAGPAALGFSTANEHWGPARDHPLILGNNAPGFPHAFLGTSHPVNLWFAKLQTRVIWGKLYESRFFPPRATIEPDRFATGLAFVLIPRGVPGLEIGGSRFFHLLWRDGVINRQNLALPFGRIARNPVTYVESDNQIASVFARWVFPETGFEIYGEYAEEDYPLNLRHALLEPDQDAGYMVGFQRVYTRTGTRAVIRGEVLNTRVNNLQLSRDQTRFYVHGPVPQGHTSIGQVLGSIGAFGGGAATLGYDRYTAAGRSSISWSRIMRAENRSIDNHVPIPKLADVMHALTVDGVRFRGRLGINYELTAVYELNRNFERDAFNVRAVSGIQYVW